MENNEYIFNNKCSVIKENFNQNMFDTNNLYNRKKLFR